MQLKVKSLSVETNIKIHTDTCPYYLCDGSGTISQIVEDELVERNCLCKVTFEE